jgi:hypothetical protein
VSAAIGSLPFESSDSASVDPRDESVFKLDLGECAGIADNAAFLASSFGPFPNNGMTKGVGEVNLGGFTQKTDSGFEHTIELLFFASSIAF